MLSIRSDGKEDAVMGLLDGKKALITGVATRKSIAWGIAQAFHEQGAQLAFTCVQGAIPRLQKLAPLVGSNLIIPCDVKKDEEIQAAVAQAAGAFGGKLDILVHSIAYVNLDDMGGEFIRISRAGWSLALEISAYSLVAMARAARPDGRNQRVTANTRELTRMAVGRSLPPSSGTTADMPAEPC